MFYSASALFDVFPKIEVGPSGGLLPPGATNVPFTLSTEGAIIRWTVPLNTLGTWVWSAMLEDTEVYANALASFGQFQGGNVSREYPAVRQQTTIFDQTNLPTVNDLAIWKNWQESDVSFRFVGERQNGTIVVGAALTEALEYLEGRVPQIEDYGERIRSAQSWFDAYKDRLFDYTGDLIRYRHRNSKLLRLLVELAKTPVVYTLGSEGLRNSTFTGNIGDALYDAGETKYSIDNQTEDPVILTTPLRLKEWALPDDGVALTPSYILPNNIVLTAAEVFDLRQRIDLYSSGASLGRALALGVQRLKAQDVPPFTLPESLGGGQKYVAIISNLVWPEGKGLDDCCVISVPLELLVAAAYPGGATPLFPEFTGFVAGAPGVFNFVPRGQRAEAELKPYTEDFKRMGYIGWEDVGTYKSARAPMGQILTDVPSLLANAHLGSQDTIRFVSQCLTYRNPAEAKADGTSD